MDPLVTTTRLTLREWSDDDAPAALAIYGAAQVARWLTPAVERIPDLEVMRSVLQTWQDEQPGLPPPQGRWAIHRNADKAVVGGVGFGFANRVRRGPIGLIGASGTGLQAVMSQIHHLGSGISQAIGTGGRDLSAVDLLVVERDGVDALDDVDGHARGGVVAEVLGDATVERTGAVGTEEDSDTGLLLSGHARRNGPRSASIPVCRNFSAA